MFAIAQQLTADDIASPSAHDPAHNRHRSGIAWSKSAVRAILTNPRYTGYEEEIGSLIGSLGGLVDALRRADPADKHLVLRGLGLKLTYNDNTRVVVAEAIPSVCVKNVSGGGHTRYPQTSHSDDIADSNFVAAQCSSLSSRSTPPSQRANLGAPADRCNRVQAARTRLHIPARAGTPAIERVAGRGFPSGGGCGVGRQRRTQPGSPERRPSSHRVRGSTVARVRRAAR
ncbi:recombinase family protein [Nocardia sp. NPDC057663]|uniref:recombinase family protein n=1 Tax=Nocardia sp. NPDC057663 TaxID=3346201 RepID=UPI00366FAB17